MKGFDMNEQRGLQGLEFVNAIRKDFNTQLPDKFPMLESAIADEFTKELHQCEIVNGLFACTSLSFMSADQRLPREFSSPALLDSETNHGPS